MAKADKKEKKEKKGKKSKKEKATNSSAASKSTSIVRKLDGSMALTKLQHVIVNKKNKKGKKIKCILLPVAANYMFEGKDGALYLNIRMNLKDGEDDFGQHGFVSHVVPSNLYKEASDEEKEKMKKTPILGGLKDWEFESTSNDSSGSMASEAIDEDDDLPF